MTILLFHLKQGINLIFFFDKTQQWVVLDFVGMLLVFIIANISISLLLRKNAWNCRLQHKNCWL